VVKLEWGTKRTCQSCSARFYDLQKSPATCPKCGAIFEQSTGNRRTRGRASTADKSADLPLDDIILVEDLELDVELVDAEDDDDTDPLMEDTSDLGEDLDDLDVLDTVDDESEER